MPTPDRPWRRTAIVPLIAATVVSGFLLLQLDYGGSDPILLPGPGLTFDESFNVQQGVYLVQAARTYGLGVLDFQSIREIFGDPVYLADHPPLGRLWLGVWHQVGWWVKPPANPAGLVVMARGRIGSVMAFGLTILLVGTMAGRWHGYTVGAWTALAIACQPRLAGHAQLGSLETVLNLAYAACVLGVAQLWGPPATQPRAAVRKPFAKERRPATSIAVPSFVAAALAGFLWGLVLLTKIQAVLLPVPFIIWAIVRFGAPASRPVLIAAAVGLCVFFVGWPYLWLDPAGHVREYFLRASSRMTISVWYMGQHYADKLVPWHFPWVISLLTVPPAILAAALFGLAGSVFFPLESSPISKSDDTSSNTAARSSHWLMRLQTRLASRDGLVFLAGLFPLIVFSFPGVAVYDGERLFLPSFVMLALFAGQGMGQLWYRLREVVLKWWPGLTTPIEGMLKGTFVLGAVFTGLFPPPNTGIAYYSWNVPNEESSYWGEGVTRPFLAEVVGTVSPGSTIAVAPVVHQFQLLDLVEQSPLLRKAGIRLVALGSPDAAAADYLLLIARRADLTPELLARLTNETPACAAMYQGRVLAALYRQPNAP